MTDIILRHDEDASDLVYSGNHWEDAFDEILSEEQ